MTDETDPEDTLRAHLSEHTRSSEFTLTRLDLGIDGWSFFQVIPNVMDSRPSYEVVRDDGTVVSGDPFSELGDIFESLRVHEDDAPPVEALVRATLALSDARVTPVLSLVQAERVAGKYSVDEVEQPALERTDDGLVLTFWGDVSGRQSTLYRYELFVDEEYTVEGGRERITSLG